MRRRPPPPMARTHRSGFLALLLVAGLAAAGCLTESSTVAPNPLGDPASSVQPSPHYLDACSPAGIDDSAPCLAMALEAVDRAREAEGLGPLHLPADFGHLSVPEQLFVTIDEERADRGLTPIAALDPALSTEAALGAERSRVPPTELAGYRYAGAEWLGALANGLDADFEWLYADGPGSGLAGCPSAGGSGCWVDRKVLLTKVRPAATLLMGAALDPTGDTTSQDRGGPSLGASLAVDDGAPASAPLYTWAQAQADVRAGTLKPLGALPADESATGIADPPHNVNPSPDYATTCAPSGIDSSARCVDAVLGAVNHARALEGVAPMVLPTAFTTLTVPEQLFVAINLERVDRGLAPFTGLVAALDANAAAGARTANDPPDAGPSYLLTDGEWAGGSANGLDAVYGFMYDDGYNSGNLDCLHPRAAGCWGHRKGILDDFGSGPDLVMGTALDLHGDNNPGDRGGTSMAATLAVAQTPPTSFVYTWAQALEAMPPGHTSG